jgi:hypothetical protein
MAFWIEYYRQNEKVMAVPCPKPLPDCRNEAVKGLSHFKADKAKILDHDHDGAVLAVVTN